MTAPKFPASVAPSQALQDLNALGVPRLSEDGLALLKPDGSVLALQCAPVVFDPPAGDYLVAQDVTLTTATPAADIFYTDDGAEPTPASTKYTVPIVTAGSGTTTIKAIALRAGYLQSEEGIADYVLPPPATVWDAADKAANLAISGGGLTLTHIANADGAWGSALSNNGRTTGKRHVEYTFSASGDLSSSYFGLSVAGFPVNDPDAAIGGTLTSWSLIPDNGGCKVQNNWQALFAPFTAPALLVGAKAGIEVDFDAGKLWFITAAGVIGGGNPATGTLPAFTFAPNTELFLGATPGYNDGDAGVLNAGATAFTLAVSAGYVGWDA